MESEASMKFMMQLRCLRLGEESDISIETYCFNRITCQR